MMSTSLLILQKPFGLFELDTTGTVLYSRVEPDGDGRGVAPDVSGLNFFDDVASFENAAELRHRIATFTDSEGQADSFHFTCLFDNGPLPVKVLLARIRERSNGRRTKSILVHIRKVQSCTY
jgi:hypothetical protein